MPLLEPVILSVSASISARTSSKSTNFFPLQCKNSAYSTHSDRVTFTREMGREGETEDKGNKKERESERENIKLNGWKQQIEDSVPSLRHCDWEAICRAATKGDWDVAVYRTDILTCFIVDQLQNERSAGHNAWATWKEVPAWKRPREKIKKNKHQICCKSDTKDIIQAIKMKRKRQEERKSYINSLLHSMSISPSFGLW